jgi:hypothetical protein
VADVLGVDFDATEFRTGIRTAMQLGMPSDVAQWPVFIRRVPPLPAPDVDSDGVPWQVGRPIASPVDVPVRALCALEWPPGTKETIEQWGPLQPGQLRVTLLDEEYRSVEGFAHMRVWPAEGGEPVAYEYRRVLGRYALGSVDVWTLLVASEDVV